jgi:hypothetical protein
MEINLKVYTWILLLLSSILFVPLVSASSAFITNENNTIWASIISIYSPNKTLEINNQTMSSVSTGLFVFEHIPDMSGNYYIQVLFYNNSGLIAIGADTLYSTSKPITEENMIPFILLIGTISIAIYFLYLSKDLMKKPKSDVDSALYKWINPQNIGTFFHVLVAWIVTIILYIMHVMSLNTLYEGITLVMFTSGLWIAGIYSFIYITLYMIFTIIASYDKRMLRVNK